MTIACATDRASPVAPPNLDFVATNPTDAATELRTGVVHLWRIPYALSEGRAPLLHMLAAYLDVPASAVLLEQETRGKPRLAASLLDATTRGLQFNWSHSGDYALIAVTRNLALGVDVERLGKNLRALEIATRFFDPVEAAALAALDGHARDRAFIALWCAKEALLKAAGAGLSFGLARLAFKHRGDNQWTLARVAADLGDVDTWQLTAFSPVPGYLGALAWRGGPCAIRALRLPDDSRAD